MRKGALLLPYTLRYTASHNNLLVVVQPLVDLIFKVLLRRVLDGAGVKEPEGGLVLVLGDGVSLGGQLPRHVLAVAAVVRAAPRLHVNRPRASVQEVALVLLNPPIISIVVGFCFRGDNCRFFLYFP